MTRTVRGLAAFTALTLIVALWIGLAPRVLLPGGTPDAGRAGLSVPAAQIEPGSIRRDVTYCTAGGVDLKLDLYFPYAFEDKPWPVAVFVHGGGYTSGDKKSVAVGGGQLRDRGYLLASVNYRLAPQYKWPAQIEDVKCAVRYLRANAAALNLDPNRIGAFGDSAGGHLVSLLGLTGPDAGFEGTGGYASQSSRVRAVADLYGPADFTGFNLGLYSPDLVQLILGTTPAKAQQTLKRASSVNYVSGDAPPFLIIQGDKDQIVPASQSRELYDKLKEAGAPATLVMVKNAGHGFLPAGGQIDPSLLDIGKTIADFFDAHVRNAQSGDRYFAETGKSLYGRFLDYWNAHGGLAQQGYPISEQLKETSDTDGKPYTVQYFERAVFELHPENTPPNDVLLSLLGSFRYKQKYPNGATGQQPNTAPGSLLFPETGKRVEGRFLEYWRANGGLAQQGYPISDEFQERSDQDGKTYTVQYFERAVFEYHPENKAPYDLLLSQLGTFRYKVRYAAGGK
ncbi:MAG: alpha/beta hydrolase fold domain-containing protein [Chloroflexia bacterium]